MTRKTMAELFSVHVPVISKYLLGRDGKKIIDSKMEIVQKQGEKY